MRSAKGARVSAALPPPPPWRFRPSFFRKFPIFELFLEKVKKPPPPRVEPNFAPIFPRDVTNMPGPYPFGARGFSPRPGFDLSREKVRFPFWDPILGTGFLDWVLSPTLAGPSCPGASS